MIRSTTLIILLLVGASNSVAQVIRTEAGLVQKVDGEVLVHCHTRESGFSSLRKGEVLHQEDLVVTTTNGSMVFSLNPGSALQMSPDTTVRIRDTVLTGMHFDVEGGEVIVFVDSLDDGVSLVLHAPPGIFEIRTTGLYRVLVNTDGNTRANVVRGELIYNDSEKGRQRLKKGRQVDFVNRISRSGRMAEY